MVGGLVQIPSPLIGIDGKTGQGQVLADLLPALFTEKETKGTLSIFQGLQESRFQVLVRLGLDDDDLGTRGVMAVFHPR